jgi:hypothetical protein
MPADGPDQKEQARRDEAELRDDQQLPSIHAVRDGAARDREHDQGNDLHQADEADGKRGPGQEEDLERQGNDGDLAAGGGDKFPDPQQSKVPVAAEGSDVHGEAPDGRTGSGEPRGRLFGGNLLLGHAGRR